MNTSLTAEVGGDVFGAAATATGQAVMATSSAAAAAASTSRRRLMRTSLARWYA